MSDFPNTLFLGIMVLQPGLNRESEIIVRKSLMAETITILKEIGVVFQFIINPAHGTISVGIRPMVKKQRNNTLDIVHVNGAILFVVLIQRADIANHRKNLLVSNIVCTKIMNFRCVYNVYLISIQTI